MITINLFYKKDSFLYHQQDIFNYLKCDHIIDYNAIISRLMKKDSLKIKPNRDIISLEIYKELRNIFKKNKKNKEDYSILHILKNFHIDVIKSIKIVLNDLSNEFGKEHNIQLFVVDSEENIPSNIKTEIDIIYYGQYKKSTV